MATFFNFCSILREIFQYNSNETQHFLNYTVQMNLAWSNNRQRSNKQQYPEKWHWKLNFWQKLINLKNWKVTIVQPTSYSVLDVAHETFAKNGLSLMGSIGIDNKTLVQVLSSVTNGFWKLDFWQNIILKNDKFIFQPTSYSVLG